MDGNGHMVGYTVAGSIAAGNNRNGERLQQLARNCALAILNDSKPTAIQKGKLYTIDYVLANA